MTITVTQVCLRSMRLCGQMGGPGRGFSTEEWEEITAVINQTIDGWSAMAHMVYSQTIERFTLVPSQAEYTIGPSGADFTANRPIDIYNANIIQTNADPEVRIPLAILDDEQFANMSVLDYQTSIPTYLYYNKNPMGSALGTLTLIGVPNTAYDLELFTQTPFDNDIGVGDNIVLPEGYIDALVYTMAERMAPLYWKKSNGMLGELKEQARKARAAIVALNAQAPAQGSDAPNGTNRWMNKGPYYSYLDGSTHRNGR